MRDGPLVTVTVSCTDCKHLVKGDHGASYCRQSRVGEKLVSVTEAAPTPPWCPLATLRVGDTLRELYSGGTHAATSRVAAVSPLGRVQLAEDAQPPTPSGEINLFNAVMPPRNKRWR